MASQTVTVEGPFIRLAANSSDMPTFWESLSRNEQQASVDQTQSVTFGSRQAWGPAGRVLQHWNTEVIPLARAVWNQYKTQICGAEDLDDSLNLDLFMIGTTILNAEPTLTIQIFDLKVAGRFVSRLRKEDRFRRTGFRVLARPGDLILPAERGEELSKFLLEAPRQLPRSSLRKADETELDLPAAASQKSMAATEGMPPQRLFGETILISSAGLVASAPREADGRFLASIATIGAIVKVGDHTFGLTAAHTLSVRAPGSTNIIQNATSTHPKRNGIYDEVFFDLFDENDNPETPLYTVLDERPFPPPNYSLESPRAIYLATSGSSSLRMISQEEKLESILYEIPMHVGDFFGWSGNSDSTDVLPVEDSTAKKYANPHLDWALFTLEDRHRFDLQNRVFLETTNSITSKITSKISKNVPTGKVLVVSKAGGYRQAHCSGALALISLPGSRELCRAYAIRYIPSTTGDTASAPGESGSLVVDQFSGDAYGLVVAASTSLNLTYMIPIKDIFDDISKQWNGSLVSFPPEISESIYSPIPEGMIRLFILEAGSYDEPIQGSLVVSRPGIRNYDFLSYSWETTRMSQPISVDKNTLKIPQSLEDALKSLRYRDKPRALWADAVCINMDDLHERSQIILYPHIVLGAAHVCVWLGHETTDTEQAFDQIERLRDLELFDKITTAPAPNPLAKFSALRSLMKRPWFSRRWIIQEIAYARSASIHCGSYQQDFGNFADAVSLLASVWDDEGPLGDFSHLPATRLLFLCQTLLRKSEDGQVFRRWLPLDWLVCFAADFKVGDARDGIYALLSLAKGTGRETLLSLERSREEQLPKTPLSLSDLFAETVALKIMRIWLNKRSIGHVQTTAISSQKTTLIAREAVNRMRILMLKTRNKTRDPHSMVLRPFRLAMKPAVKPYRVNYSLSFIEVAIDFISFTIATSKSIDIVCRAWAPAWEARDLPSWIKSIRNAEFGMNYKGEPVRLNAEPLTRSRLLEISVYRAGRRLEATPSISGRHLTVQGFTFDTISQIEMPALLGNIPWEWFELGGWDISDKEIPKQLVRTLVADRSNIGERTPRFYDLLCRWLLSHSMVGADINVKELVDRGEPRVLVEYLKRVRSVVWSRRLIKTSGGNLGLVPRACQLGDNICILDGCSVPVVLRKASQASDLWELIGECFIDGIMDGEALDSGTPSSEFVLV